MEIAESLLETVGETPLVAFRRMFSHCRGRVAAKVEERNPSGSVKDRIAAYMIRRAEKDGRLRPGGTIVESTSGNTGAALAVAGRILGYRVILVVTTKISQEKLDYLKALGAEVVVCPSEIPVDDPRSYHSTVRRIAAETPGACHLNQNENEANRAAHYNSTGPEIWRQTDGGITHFVAGIGTGGTLSGTGAFLKEKNPRIRVIGVEPTDSIFRARLLRQAAERPAEAASKVEGIGGSEIVPENVDFSVIDEIIQVTDEECFTTARRMAREEGMMAGGSAGGAVAAALKIAPGLGDDDLMVVILPDGGDRYLSKFYNDDWMRENGFPVD